MIHPRTLQSLEFGKVIELLASLCLSDGGRDLARALKPYPERKEAVAALALYEDARNLFATGTFAAAPFPDASFVLKEVKASATPLASRRSAPDLETFWILRQILRPAREARTAIGREDGAALWPGLFALVADHSFPEQLAAALNRCVSDDGALKDESSPELYRLRSEARKLHRNCLRRVKDFARQYNMENYLQDDFITLSSDRYALPLKANFKGRMQGIIHDWSQTGETCYFEPIFLVEINNRLQELKREERQEEKKILDYLASLLAEEIDSVIDCVALLSTLDLENAKSRLADLLDARPIDFTPDSDGVNLIAARHPVLALARLESKGKLPDVRPLDIVLRPGERVLIITGGNAGGKTVCLKTLGLVAAMAMSGLPVPVAQGSHLPWFERVDAFIGDEQSIDDNVSTFTAQIEHLVKAWKHLDHRGLVLLDEFGAGTDPAEGSALAQAVLDELLEKRCFTLAATHFPALKSYALTREGARAATMLFDPDSRRPLFRLAYDQIGGSQALAVAEAHGLPESILNKARRYLLQDGTDSAAVLDRLNALAAKREEEIAELNKEREKSRRALADREEKLDRERKKLAGELRDKIAELMSRWRADKLTAKQTARALSGLRAELGLPDPESDASVLPPAEDFAPGRRIFHIAFNKSGVIKETDEKRGRVRVDLDGVSLWANPSDLRVSGAKPKNEKSASVNVADTPASLSIDVRGQRAEEAIASAEKFIDKALLSGFGQVEIVHGRGSGALRRSLHDFLRSFAPVRSFALAPEDRGGDGMTIVDLR